MATFTVKLDDDTLHRLTEAAKRVGVTPERLAEMTLESLLFDGDGFHGSDRDSIGVREPARAWTDEAAGARMSGEGRSGHDQCTTAEDYEGPFVDLDEALDGFKAELNRRLKSSAG